MALRKTDMKVTLTFELDHDEVAILGEAVDLVEDYRKKSEKMKSTACDGIEQEMLRCELGPLNDKLKSMYSDIGRAVVLSKASF